MNTGVPPTDLKARTGEFTPPGNNACARSNRLEETERVVAMERLAEKEEGETEVAPEVAAARAELQSQPLAEEDLGDEAGADEDEGEDEDEGAEDGESNGEDKDN